jgi:hypothetical protein
MQPALTTTRNDLIVCANRAKRLGTQFALRNHFAAGRDCYNEAADLYDRAGAEGFAVEARQDAAQCNRQAIALILRGPVRLATVDGRAVA